MEKAAKCSRCGAPLPSAAAPCLNCGRRPVPLVLRSEAQSSANLDLSILSPNGALARRLELERAFKDIEAAVQRRNNWDAQHATKRALEALHELADCLRRNEWTQVGWNQADRGLWTAHIGARNMAHHSSSSVVRLHGAPSVDEQLNWAFTPAAVNDLASARQAADYSGRLDGQPVLPALRKLLARIQGSVA
jgi:hypothetical protein